MSEPKIVADLRAAIKTEALDRFAEPYLADDARDWLAGFAARAAARVMAEQLAEVRLHLKEMRTFLAVEMPECTGTRRANDAALAVVSDLTRGGDVR